MGGKRLGLTREKGEKKLPKIVQKGDTNFQMVTRLPQTWFRIQDNFNADIQAVHKTASSMCINTCYIPTLQIIKLILGGIWIHYIL